MAMDRYTGTIPSGGGTEVPLPDVVGADCHPPGDMASQSGASDASLVTRLADCERQLASYERLLADYERRQNESVALIASMSNMINCMSQQLVMQSHQQQAMQERIDELEAHNRQADDEQDRRLGASGLKLLFKFEGQNQKKKIYSMMLELDKEKYIINTQKEFIHFMAINTNLGSEDSIRTQFYGYKQQM